MVELKMGRESSVGMKVEWKFTIGKEKKPKVIVVSHERSGTHFLINSLAANYGYINDPWLDIDHTTLLNPWSPECILDMLMRCKGLNVLNVFKSHHDVGFFSPILNEVLSEFMILYIWRKDEAALFRSFRKHINEFPWFTGPKVETWRDLVAAPPHGSLTRYQSQHRKDMGSRWSAHLGGWLVESARHPRIHSLKYEDLDENFDQEITKIGVELGLTPAFPIRRPARDVNVIANTGMGGANDWAIR